MRTQVPADDAGTSATARTRNACGKSAAGKRLAARLNVARTHRVKAQHAQAEKERRQQAKSAPKAVENPEVAPARGHAAEIFFPLPYAIGQAATNPP